MDNNYYIPQQKFEVLVRCFTYNQSSYIQDTLNGFAMQKTSFAYACVIIDDCSTDNEQNIIKSWFDHECDMDKAERIDIPSSYIIVAPHKSNTNCLFACYFLKQNLYNRFDEKMRHLRPWQQICTYEALCEGDDYWIDENKLQQQVECLDNHPDCILCVTDAQIISPNGELFWKRYNTNTRVPIDDIILGGGIWLQTATYMMRKGAKDDMIECGRLCHAGDYALILWCALKGNIYYLNMTTAVYRYGYGWTRTNSQMSIEKQISGYRSEINMLRGYDLYSKGQFHNAFTKRQCNYIFRFVDRNIGNINVKRIIDSFPEMSQDYTIFQRLMLFLAYNNCVLVYRTIKTIRRVFH